MQTTAIGTVTNSLPQNEVILLTLLISGRYISYTDLSNIYEIAHSYNLFIAQTHILIFMKDMRAYFPRCVHVKSSGREYRGNKRPTDAGETA